MAFIVVFTVLSLLIAYISYYYWTVAKYPKGPRPLPLVGNILSFDFENTHTHLQKLSKVYGDVFTVFLPHPTVCLMSYDGVRDAFVNKGEEFSARSGLYPDDLTQCIHNGGVTFSQGEQWRNSRRISLHILRDFGLGSQIMEIQVRASMEDCLVQLRGLCAGNTPVNFRWPIQIFVTNVVSNILFGTKYKHNDYEGMKAICGLIEVLSENFRKNKLVFLPRMFPWVEKVPILGHKAAGHARDIMKQVYEKVAQRVEQAMVDFDPTMEPENFCQSYYQKQMKEGTYDEKKLLNICLDIFIAGMDTTTTTLRWAILFLTHYKDVQNKMRSEIESVIGPNFPTQADRSKLPYCNAVISEIMRKSNIISNNILHRATKDTTILQHSIPADTLVLSHLFNIHEASEVFVEPEKFRPERFLEEDGVKTKTDVMKHLVPFSMGKRQCLGESLARLELFICIISLVQNFSLDSHADHPIKFESINGIFLYPHDPSVLLTPLTI